MSVIGSGGVEQNLAEFERAASPPGKPEPRRMSEPAGKSGRPGGGRRGIRNRDGLAGALFMAPAVILIVVFVLLPVLSALWVSVSDWSGKGSPLNASFAGLDNYR